MSGGSSTGDLRPDLSDRDKRVDPFYDSNPFKVYPNSLILCRAHVRYVKITDPKTASNNCHKFWGKHMERPLCVLFV
jgi:hypothetical protein